METNTKKNFYESFLNSFKNDNGFIEMYVESGKKIEGNLEDFDDEFILISNKRHDSLILVRREMIISIDISRDGQETIPDEKLKSPQSTKKYWPFKKKTS